jgi:histidine ammonia-lyase
MDTPYIRIASIYEDLQAVTEQADLYRERVATSRKRVEEKLGDGAAYYGINTGFGVLASKRISTDQVEELQHNFLLSHAVGVGPLIRKDISRLMLMLKVHCLGLGYSGVSVNTFERLLQFAERDIVPAVRSKGSLGASGDLAPLAHLSLPLIGKGIVWNECGKETADAADVLKQHRLSPITLQAKDGLALCNGTQMMSAYGVYILERALRLVKYADLIGAMSLEALQGSSRPFDERIHSLRPHPGQMAVAENVRRILEQSEILESHRECGKVQDPYSLRCIPQVHGATRDAINYAVSVLEIEINSVTDNPLVMEDGDIVSGGNFHGQPLAFALDFAAIALAELANISDRRIYLLLEGHDGLPTLLMQDTGLHSGFMIPQYTAASLVAENKVLCHPASVDSIPTCLGQEDHVSMGSISATKLLEVYRNVERVLSIEMLVAAQALDFRKPRKPGRGVEILHQFIRKTIQHRCTDDLFNHDMESCRNSLRNADLLQSIEKEIGALQ